MGKGLLKQKLRHRNMQENEGHRDVKPEMQNKQQEMHSMNKVADEGYGDFLRSFRDRIDRVGIELPKIEVRFEHLTVEGEAYVGHRALPNLLNSTLNTVDAILGVVGVSPSKKKTVQILRDANGIVRPSRLTLLLGPPGSGKTTLLHALSGKLEDDLKVLGKITYCGHKFSEFVPQRTCSYVSSLASHHAEMTVRETLNFSGRCLGAGIRTKILVDLSRQEKKGGIEPDPVTNAFVEAAIAGQNNGLITNYVLKLLSLDACADVLVGDEMRRGISGGEMRRLTTGEMLVGPARAFFMDEISTGLDSSTTYQIVNFLGQIVHIMDMTMVVSLLQPAPETYDLFDDIILLSEGQIVYQGPRENVLEFFEYVGFKCPERKGVADFLQEVTSMKDQEQYWFRREQPYRCISVTNFVQAFKSFHIGMRLLNDLSNPFDKSSVLSSALIAEKYAISGWELFRACFSREWMLMKRNYFMYVFRSINLMLTAMISLTAFPRSEMKAGQRQGAIKFFGALFLGLMNIMFSGMVEVPLMVSRLPTFFKQRDSLFFPGWTFGLPIWLLCIPISVMESGLWVVLTYYPLGFAPAFSRFLKQFLALFSVHQAALSLFRFMAVVGRTQVLAHTLGAFVLLLFVVLGGFIVSRDDIEPFMKWASFISPVMYGQNAISINEFLADRWNAPTSKTIGSTLGKSLLKERGFYADEYWYWTCVAVLLGLSLLFNLLIIAALKFLNPLRNFKAIIADDDSNNGSGQQLAPNSEGTNGQRSTKSSVHVAKAKRGMVLSFQPLSVAFSNVNYYVDMPKEMKSQGMEKARLQLLEDVSGAFRPGILTALVGVSGAGKTTLMDVLAGRKTSGYVEGSISISGYPKKQATFVRVCGYCEQTDIHSPYVTVYEAIMYSAWLRLQEDVQKGERKMFVEEVMDLVELKPLRNALVGLQGVDGLSTEQRKRLTIAVELVSNPSIIFMDEPTSGLDARAAAVVMRAVRNTVDTGRTVVCTIHQPSTDVFEAFDELLLMKKGGRLMYAGPLGRHSHKLIEYFEGIEGIPEIKEGHNPATWMLEISSPAVEAELVVDFAEIYKRSDLYRRNQELVKELSTPQSGSKDLYFPTRYSQNILTQFKACFWKQYLSYWRNAEFNAIRFFITIVISVFFGLIFWNKGSRLETQQDLFDLVGCSYASIILLGALNADTILPVVAMERTVFYREQAAGMYSTSAYAFAQVAVETVYVAIQSLVYALPLYPMIGFDFHVDKFMYFYYFIFICFTYFSLFGMMVIALTPGPQLGAVLMFFFVNMWNLFCGFLLPQPQIPKWWRWFYWCNPVAWTIYGIIASQVGDNKRLLQIPGSQPMSVDRIVKEYFNFHPDFLLPVVLANVAWCLLFSLVFTLSIKYLNFQRR